MNEPDGRLELTPSRALLTALVRARVEKILSRVCVDFRDKSFTPEQAYAAVAQIAALRLLEGDLANPVTLEREAHGPVF